LLETKEQRGGHDRRDQGHDHEHAEDARRDHAQFEADVDHDQLHQRSGVHHHADAAGFAIAESAQASGERASAPFSDDRRGGDAKCEEPHGSAADRADVSAQAGVGEKDRQEESGHEIAQSLGDGVAELFLIGHRRAEDECAENREDADDACRDRAEEHDDDEEGQRVDGEEAFGFGQRLGEPAHEQRAHDENHDSSEGQRLGEHQEGVDDAEIRSHQSPRRCASA